MGQRAPAAEFVNKEKDISSTVTGEKNKERAGGDANVGEVEV